METYDWTAHQSRRRMFRDLLARPTLATNTWQAMSVRGSKAHRMHELEDVTIVYNVPSDWASLIHDLKPDTPWAEDHFQERVSGTPYNPPPSAEYWPHAVRANGDHVKAGQFDHTYPERFWPKHAGDMHGQYYTGDPNVQAHHGIRFAYGDLRDVVRLLALDHTTRQAYLPVWFPEDTGATDSNDHPIRVPCSLGYHFMIRNGHLSCRYYIRSMDAYRHMTNDIYMASRLMQWVAENVNAYPLAPVTNGVPEVGGWVVTGRLIVHVASLHLFVADESKVESWI